MSVLAACAIAAAVSYGVGWLVRRFGADKALDEPKPRSLHELPRTRLGGLAVVAGLFGGLIAQQMNRSLGAVLAAAGIAGLAGLIEDVRGLPISVRLIAQTIAAATAAGLVVAGTAPGWLLIVGAMWIVVFVNEFNFMDGIDGLAASQLAVAGLTWTIAGGIEGADQFQVLGAVSLGAALGFLSHNAPRAHVFMGDVGAYAAGAWLATSAIVGINLDVHPVTVLAPLAVVVFDATLTLVRRLARGDNVVIPHRSHLYQRLVLAGWTHARTSLFVAVFSVAVSAAGLLAITGTTVGVTAATMLGLCGVAAYAIVAIKQSGPYADLDKEPIPRSAV